MSSNLNRLMDRSLITTWGVRKLDAQMCRVSWFPPMQIARFFRSSLREYAENLDSPLTMCQNRHSPVFIQFTLKKMKIMCKNQDCQW